MPVAAGNGTEVRYCLRMILTLPKSDSIASVRANDGLTVFDYFQKKKITLTMMDAIRNLQNINCHVHITINDLWNFVNEVEVTILRII